jgi:hypothetical protein
MLRKNVVMVKAQTVIAGLDPAIHPLRNDFLMKDFLTKNDGYAGQARV